jgi:hypothetical protein
MLPNLRFIAGSVVATVAMMMFGFGLFAAFRLANQSSVVLARTGDVPPSFFAQGPEEQPPSIAPPSPAADAAPAMAPDTAPAAEAAPTAVPDLPAPAAEAAPTEVPEVPAPGAEIRRASPPAEAAPDAVAPSAAEIAAPPSPVTSAAAPEPAEAVPPPSPSSPGVEPSPVAAEAPPSAEPPPVETTASLKPGISAKEVARAPTAAPQAKPKRKIAKPARKPVRRAVRQVAPTPAQPVDSLTNWSTTNAQWDRLPTLQPRAQPQRQRSTRAPGGARAASP